MKELTKAEEEIMQILWTLEKAFVKDILAEFKEPKPAYNTVSTIIRILEKKDFVGYKAFGKTHQYYPILTKEAYKSQISKSLISNYFGGSVENLVSFFAKKEEVNVEELDQILNQLKAKKK
ncbi:MAG: BlaI/MecI/CopY family transcriptional regulator [Bacteroidetes bacterium]|nr:MAG: BlaI/MecI/CopY family transcriptional regulator [Bacteroidota bacterium]MBL1145678.1 BlaI/MecI/CopY family transcriptional regulator [Bacteroidota bacterium]NOG58472.1 BlaI/MecI/CopY family transcriptional regulator [Bacteroidota bacterium]